MEVNPSGRVWFQGMYLPYADNMANGYEKLRVGEFKVAYNEKINKVQMEINGIVSLSPRMTRVTINFLLSNSVTKLQQSLCHL